MGASAWWVPGTGNANLPTFAYASGKADGFNLDAVKLSFERRGTLYLEHLEEVVRIYLARRHGRLDGDQLRMALELCSPEERRGVEVHAGLQGDDDLVFLTCIPSQDFIPSTLSNVLAELERLHDRVAQER